jgi:DNA-binding MarR family transcriptional regulator
VQSVTGEEREITLGLLNAVHNNSNVTQRSVAKELGVALGLTNSYLKRCAKKGLIKVQQAPANRYAYYLTPEGFAEKAKLTKEFLTQGFQFFRYARIQCTEIFEICTDLGWNRIALLGLTDVAEIAILCIADFDVEIVGIVDESSSMDEYSGIPIVQNYSDLTDLDALIISDLGNPQSIYEKMIKKFPAERVLVPAVLNVTPREKYLWRSEQ